jgi:hypothetical protein
LRRGRSQATTPLYYNGTSVRQGSSSCSASSCSWVFAGIRR